MKKHLHKLLFVVMAFMVAAGAYAIEVDGINYELNSENKTASVANNEGRYSGDIVIPSQINVDGVTYSVTSIGYIAFVDCSGLTSVSIPNSVTSIGIWAFLNCNGLTSVSIPNSVTSIGGSAFHSCSSLTSVTIGSSVTSIEPLAFGYCCKLTSIDVDAANEAYCSIDGVVFNKAMTEIIAYPAGRSGEYIIPNSVTSIGASAFAGCSGLTSVSIPNSVTSIGDGAFSGCSGLTSVSIPNSVTSIGDGAFSGCSGLTSVSIPNSVTSIGDWAFSGCSGLTSVSIPNSATTIGREAFAGCTGLTAVTIPATVTGIEARAFADCEGLTAITMDADVPPTTAADALNGVPSSCVIRVPAGSREAYAAAAPWNKFTIEEYGSETGIGRTPNTGLSIVGYYDMEGRRLGAPVKGTCIVRYSDGTTRKVIIK